MLETEKYQKLKNITTRKKKDEAPAEISEASDEAKADKPSVKAPEAPAEPKGEKIYCFQKREKKKVFKKIDLSFYLIKKAA